MFLSVVGYSSNLIGWGKIVEDKLCPFWIFALSSIEMSIKPNYIEMSSNLLCHLV